MNTFYEVYEVLHLILTRFSIFWPILFYFLVQPNLPLQKSRGFNNTIFFRIFRVFDIQKFESKSTGAIGISLESQAHEITKDKQLAMLYDRYVRF